MSHDVAPGIADIDLPGRVALVESLRSVYTNRPHSMGGAATFAGGCPDELPGKASWFDQHHIAPGIADIDLPGRKCVSSSGTLWQFGSNNFTNCPVLLRIFLAPAFHRVPKTNRGDCLIRKVL